MVLNVMGVLTHEGLYSGYVLNWFVLWLSPIQHEIKNFVLNDLAIRPRVATPTKVHKNHLCYTQVAGVYKSQTS